jgi:uncharacterized protein YyaL (SSP411 family)
MMLSNRLAAETSPYLQQHAENPVDWHPWGEEALTLARREEEADPACPSAIPPATGAMSWPTNPSRTAVAAVMNRLFVNIKVDREERPDLDQIYQTAHQMLTRP